MHSPGMRNTQYAVRIRIHSEGVQKPIRRQLKIHKYTVFSIHSVNCICEEWDPVFQLGLLVVWGVVLRLFGEKKTKIILNSRGAR